MGGGATAPELSGGTFTLKGPLTGGGIGGTPLGAPGSGGTAEEVAPGSGGTAPGSGGTAPGSGGTAPGGMGGTPLGALPGSGGTPATLGIGGTEAAYAGIGGTPETGIGGTPEFTIGGGCTSAGGAAPLGAGGAVPAACCCQRRYSQSPDSFRRASLGAATAGADCNPSCRSASRRFCRNHCVYR
ncbi:MAG: hypothetical protein R3B07_09340 [Polyangiaceae bacterium]